jgi:hypothetical protein
MYTLKLRNVCQYSFNTYLIYLFDFYIKAAPKWSRKFQVLLKRGATRLLKKLMDST